MPIRRFRKKACALLLAFGAAGLVPSVAGQETQAEQLIRAGHWKRARALVQARLHEAPNDALASFLLSQIRYAFGDHSTPLALAEKAVALNDGVGKYHRQLAEVLGTEAQHAGPLRLLFLARRFRREIDTALALDPRDCQALRDLMEFYLVAPGVAGGDTAKAEVTGERIHAIDASEGLLAKARIAGFRKQSAAQEALLQKAGEDPRADYEARIEWGEFAIGKEHAELDTAEITAQEALRQERSRIDAYRILADVYAARGAWSALDAILTEASEAVPDDLAPYYRAAARLLKNGRDPIRAERYLRVYLSKEPEGNEPTAEEARGKLALALSIQRRAGGGLAQGNEPHGAATEIAVQ